MKLVLGMLILFVGLRWTSTQHRYGEDVEDNEFAEFEDFDEEEDASKVNGQVSSDAAYPSRQKRVENDETSDVDPDGGGVEDDETVVEVRGSQTFKHHLHSV